MQIDPQDPILANQNIAWAYMVAGIKVREKAKAIYEASEDEQVKHDANSIYMTMDYMLNRLDIEARARTLDGVPDSITTELTRTIDETTDVVGLDS